MNTVVEPVPGRRKFTLPAIVVAQFAGTSLWFAGNAVLGDLQAEQGFDDSLLSYMTSSVQLGFILGTLVFAVYQVADRFSPRRLFFGSTVASAITNLLMLATSSGGVVVLIGSRMITGFFLAGVYPVGMKIAASWFRPQELGNAIGWLVGALVLGTAFPHLLKTTSLPSWQSVAGVVSCVAVLGGILVLALVPDGPLLARKPPPAPASPTASTSITTTSSGSARSAVTLPSFQPRAILAAFQRPEFRASSFGYFGHQWEVYTLWSFLPRFLDAYKESQQNVELFNTSLMCFFVIGFGGVGCAVGGMISQRIARGSALVAFWNLSGSGVCCLLSPLFFNAPLWLLVLFLLFWGFTVVADSPQFSALNAGNAPRELVGSALTMVVCMGFTITIVSIQTINGLVDYGIVSKQWGLFWMWVGPALGLYYCHPLTKLQPATPSAFSNPSTEHGNVGAATAPVAHGQATDIEVASPEETTNGHEQLVSGAQSETYQEFKDEDG